MSSYFLNKNNYFTVVLKTIPQGKSAPKKNILAEFKTEIEAQAAVKITTVLLNENFIPNDQQINNWIHNKMS
jgi:hypothetical protein